MSRIQKAREKFVRRPPPRDLRWEELVYTLATYGFELNQENGGSHHFFVLRRRGLHYRINAVRPHPDTVIKIYQIKEIVRKLADWGIP